MRSTILIAALLLPACAFAASFDCKRAASTSERLICSDAELSRLDDDLSRLYRRVKASETSQQAFRAQTRAAWQWREANCATKDCLLSWYADRKRILKAMTGAATGPMGSSCLKEDSPVQLSGVVSRETFPGPPNFESVEDGDAPRTVWILTVAKAVCVTALSEESREPGEAVATMNRFQLVFVQTGQYEKHRGLVGSRAVVKGRLFEAHTAYHHTAMLMVVGSIEGVGE